MCLQISLRKIIKSGMYLKQKGHTWNSRLIATSSFRSAEPVAGFTKQEQKDLHKTEPWRIYSPRNTGVRFLHMHRKPSPGLKLNN